MSVKFAKSFLSTIFPLVIPIVGIYGTITLYRQHKANKKIRTNLQHVNQYQQQGYIITNSTQIMNKYNTLPLNQPIDYRGKEIVRPYMEQFERALGNDIRIARNNFSTLRIEKSKEIAKTGAAGIYNGTENVIKYVKNNANIMGHEMLHMASYMYDNTLDTHYHGFMQQKGEAIIGRGLNEGYTELMNSRLFTNGKITAYKRLVRIVKLIEEFFPNPQMMSHYYFTCDLPAVLQNLRRYCTQEETNEILLGLDRLYEYEYVPGSPLAITLETQLASKLYNIYQRNFIAEPAKVQAFKQKAGENKLTAMVIAGKQMRATRTNPFTRIKSGIQNGFRKIKNFFTGTPSTNPQPAYAR